MTVQRMPNILQYVLQYALAVSYRIAIHLQPQYPLLNIYMWYRRSCNFLKLGNITHRGSNSEVHLHTPQQKVPFSLIRCSNSNAKGAYCSCVAWGLRIYNIVESESDPLTRRPVDLFEKEPLKGNSEVHLHTPSKFGEDPSKDLGGDREYTHKRCSNYSMTRKFTRRASKRRCVLFAAVWREAGVIIRRVLFAAGWREAGVIIRRVLFAAGWREPGIVCYHIYSESESDPSTRLTRWPIDPLTRQPVDPVCFLRRGGVSLASSAIIYNIVKVKVTRWPSPRRPVDVLEKEPSIANARSTYIRRWHAPQQKAPN